MPENKYVGWDIGGAHLKMACVGYDGIVLKVEQHATPLWQGLGSLQTALNDVKARLVDDKLTHAVTTTGELADLFQHRKQGVDVLLKEFCKVFASEQVRVYAGPAGLITVSEANRQYQQVASANWYATAEYIASKQSEGVLIDIGSSTTDVVPFMAGKVSNRGYTDQERMRYDELLYTGTVRTPLMAIVSRVPFAGEWQSVAAEQFASIADVYRITGELDESIDLMSTADGAGKQILDSIRRIARMLGCDVQDRGAHDEYHALAYYIAEQHIQKIDLALQRVISASSFSLKPHLVGAGTGRFLAAKLAQRHKYQYTDFAQMLSVNEVHQSRAADCATAVAVAQLRRLAG